MEGLCEVRGAAVVVESTFCSLQPVQNIKHIINYLCCCSLIQGHCKQRAAEDKIHRKYKTGRFVKEGCKSHLNAVSCFVTVYRSTLQRSKDLNGKSRSDR